MHKVVGLQLFWSWTPTFSSGTPTFCQMGVLNSCFQNPSESSVNPSHVDFQGLIITAFISVSLTLIFKFPQHMFWLRNKKIIFLLRTLN